ncbi:MAG TPA: DUF427 domain-containing protein [Bacteriovoracaceae bacterium]|nr:DUF427 domain-containing protein [Bacteriovoracaceae bacterium]
MLSPDSIEYPDHRVTTERLKKRLEVFIDGEKVAETTDVIKLNETNYEPRFYIPIKDIRGIDFIKFDDYYCPFKGHAELYTVKHGPRRFENAAWSYVRPFDEFKELKGRVAFYPSKVQAIRITG